MNCYEIKRRTKGLSTFPNEEHGRASRGCGDGSAGAMAFPIVNGKADFRNSEPLLIPINESIALCRSNESNCRIVESIERGKNVRSDSSVLVRRVHHHSQCGTLDTEQGVTSTITSTITSITLPLLSLSKIFLSLCSPSHLCAALICAKVPS